MPLPPSPRIPYLPRRSSTLGAELSAAQREPRHRHRSEQYLDAELDLSRRTHGRNLSRCWQGSLGCPYSRVDLAIRLTEVGPIERVEGLQPQLDASRLAQAFDTNVPCQREIETATAGSIDAIASGIAKSALRRQHEGNGIKVLLR